MTDKSLTDCEKCGSKLSFDISRQELACEHCGASVNIPAVSINDRKNQYYDGVEVETETCDFAQYKCGQCGSINTFQGDGELKRCPSCGVYGGLTKIQKNIKKIDGIVPFKIPKEQAQNELRTWVKNCKFTPNDFRELFDEGKTMAFYYPAYIFDANGAYTFSGRTEHTNYVTGADGVRRSVTYTQPFDGRRAFKKENYVSSASTLLPDGTIQGLTDFNVDALIKYELPFVAGFPVNEADVSISAAHNVFRSYMKQKFEKEIRSAVTNGHVVNLSVSPNYQSETYQLALLPIWATYYTYKGKKYNCFINGYSGKVVGKHPKSFWKIFGRFVGTAILLFGLGLLGAWLLKIL